MPIFFSPLLFRKTQIQLHSFKTTTLTIKFSLFNIISVHFHRFSPPFNKGEIYIYICSENGNMKAKYACNFFFPPLMGLKRDKSREQNGFITKSYVQTWLLFYIIIVKIQAFVVLVDQFFHPLNISARM